MVGMKYFLLVLTLIGFGVACSLEVPPPVVSTSGSNVENPFADQPIDGDVELRDLRVGQGQRYVGFSTSGFPTHTNPNISHTTDTLIQKVVKEDDNGFLIAEYLTDNSISRTTFNGPTSDPDSVFRYYLRVENDTVQVLPKEGEGQVRSHFFGFSINGNHPILALNAPATPDVTESWDGEFCGACEKTAFIGEWEVFGAEYTNLRAHLDNRDVQVDGLGLFHIYRPEGGLLRGAFNNPFLNEGRGWDRLPD